MWLPFNYCNNIILAALKTEANWSIGILLNGSVIALSLPFNDKKTFVIEKGMISTGWSNADFYDDMEYL